MSVDGLLSASALELSSAVVGQTPGRDTVGEFDSKVEDCLSTLDSITSRLDISRASVSASLQDTFPTLLAKVEELQVLFDLIDAMEQQVAIVHDAAVNANTRLDLLQRVADSKQKDAAAIVSTAITGTISKLGSFFGGLGKAKPVETLPAATVVGAPAALPSWDASSSRVDSSSMLVALSSGVGDVKGIVEADNETRALRAAVAEARKEATGDRAGDQHVERPQEVLGTTAGSVVASSLLPAPSGLDGANQKLTQAKIAASAAADAAGVKLKGFVGNISGFANRLSRDVGKAVASAVAVPVSSKAPRAASTGDVGESSGNTIDAHVESGGGGQTAEDDRTPSPLQHHSDDEGSHPARRRGRSQPGAIGDDGEATAGNGGEEDGGDSEGLVHTFVSPDEAPEEDDDKVDAQVAESAPAEAPHRANLRGLVRRGEDDEDDEEEQEDEQND